jgi:hypothetical protein
MPDALQARTPPPPQLDSLHPKTRDRKQKSHHSVARRTVRTPRPRSRGVQKRRYKFTCTFCWETYRVGEGVGAGPAGASLASCGASSSSSSAATTSRRGVSATSSPRIVGTSARIACEACWVQLHNLSICWACGDSVVRGEECVSFGWTFWHRGCFGCLSCRVGCGISSWLLGWWLICGVDRLP